MVSRKVIQWRKYNIILKKKKKTNTNTTKNINYRRATIISIKNEIKIIKQDNKNIKKIKQDIKIIKQNIKNTNRITDFFNNPVINKEININKNSYNLLNDLYIFHNDFNLLETANNTTFIKKSNTFFDRNTPIEIGKDKESDKDIEYDLIHRAIKKITLRWVRKQERPNGAFFPFYNKTELDLTKFQIFKESDIPNNLNCLQKALKEGGLDNKKFVNLITLFIKDGTNIAKNDYIPINKLIIICNSLNICIELTYYNKNGISVKKIIPPLIKGNINNNPIFKIGLLSNHYFINEDTLYTKENLGLINKNNKYPKLNSIQLIKLLLKNKETLLTPITNQNNTSPYNFKNLKNYETLYNPTNKNIKRIEKKEIKPPSIFKNEEFKVGYFDFEAITDTEIHTAYQIAFESRDGEKLFFQGNYCALDFLKSIKTNMILYAHNLKYDLQFLIKYLLNHSSFIKTGSQCKTISGIFINNDTKKTVKLCFKDSMSIISAPLSSFGKMFNLEQNKEILPYEIYNQESIKQESIKIEIAQKYLTEEKYILFKENIKKWNLELPNGYFNHMKYSEIYCKMDVEVLKNGYEKMKEWMFEITKINIDYIISLPQLAYTYGVNENVFLNCYSVSGAIREFIQRCLVGGRTMTRANKQYHIKDTKLQDFDGVSLYPSAIEEMDGFLKGTPKVILSKNLNKEFLDKQDGYFIEVDILDIPIKYSFPLLSTNNEGESRNFSNDIRGRGIYLDKVSLEDAINFQNIKYKIIRGYYFNSGRNTNNKDFINKLFNERLIKKQEKNPIEQCYKLLMNSFYGKTIQNPILKKYTFVQDKEKDMNKFLYNSATMISSTQISNNLYMLEEHNTIHEHFSLPHIGIEILSMSKRIMNRVMCLAEDNNINIYYQDTDSMHIENDKIELLSNKFKEKYNKELIGSKMGQFHSDFNFKSDILPVAIESIFLGKKCYLDVVECSNNGIITKEIHCRMKGIPSSCIKNFQCVNLTENTDLQYLNALDIYLDLFKGDELAFELVNRRYFQCNKNFTYSKRDEAFIRRIKFQSKQ